MTPDPQSEPTSSGPTSAPDQEAEQLFTIGELAEEFDITTRAIRFYEARGLIKPQRRGANRSYSRRDRARLILILRGKNLGFSLEDIAEYLNLYDADPSQLAQTRLLMEKVEAHITDLQQKRADIDRTLRDLKDIRAKCVEMLKSAGKTTADTQR
jgi:DNA-binding transcriptional MerR regulator